jgi:hypothetical protein
MDWEHAHLAVLHAVAPISLNIYSYTRRPPSGTRACVAPAEPGARSTNRSCARCGDEADDSDLPIDSGRRLTP